jgi:hypothetical protein
MSPHREKPLSQPPSPWTAHAGQAPIPDDCTRSSAIHDLASLSEGNLSDEGKRRLAGHVPHCAVCRTALASLIRDAQQSQSTGNHQIAWLASLATSALCAGSGK